MTRALLVTRLSRDTDASTSIERQREACEAEAARRGWSVIGHADDVDVSGSTSPFDRPELGGWLAEPSRFDAIVAYRMDRISRSLLESKKLDEWAEEHGVQIVSATESDDPLSRDVRGVVGEWELKAISARNASAFEHNITKGNYRGGNPPLGYRAEKVNGEWRYVPDETLAPLTRDIVARVISGEPVTHIVRQLNDDNVLTPQDHHRVAAGKEPKGMRWTVANLIRQLESETLLGYAMRSEVIVGKSGKPVITKDSKGNRRKKFGPKQVIYVNGEPVKRAEEIISPGEFQRLQAALKVRRGASPKRRVNPTSLLLQVIFCGLCGRPMYRLVNNRPHQYYRCGSFAYQTRCSGRSVRLEVADQFVEDSLLSMIGDLPFLTREYVPGTDNAEMIAGIDAQLLSIATAIPRFTGAALDSLIAQADGLNERRAELASEPYRPAGYEYTPTGRTFREWWTSADTDARNRWLREHDVRLDWAHPRDSALKANLTFGDLPAMFAAVDPGIAKALDQHGDEFRQYLDKAIRTEGTK